VFSHQQVGDSDAEAQTERRRIIGGCGIVPRQKTSVISSRSQRAQLRRGALQSRLLAQSNEQKTAFVYVVMEVLNGVQCRRIQN
jgi:hypothetical protein